MADVASVENSIMANRSYGSDAAAAGAMAGAMVQGLKEQGIASCLKHFQGLGAGNGDPLRGFPLISLTMEQFESR